MAPRKTRSRSPHPEDRAWVSQTMRKRGMTAIKKNYQFGKDCGTIAVLAFYNKIHGFWDGSVYTPDGESLPENTNDVIHDIWRRQVVSNGELVLRPARQRKQAANTKPCRVTKPAPKPSPRVLSLRSRGRQCDGSSGPGASPTQPQIIVAGDGESEAEDDGESIWDVPASPAPRVTRRRGRGNAGPGETATRIRRQARLDACADHAVRDLGSTDNHISDDDPDNADGEGDDHHHVYRGDRRRSRVRDRSEPAEPNNAASSHLHDYALDDQDAMMPYTSIEDEDAEGEPWCEPTVPFASMAMNGQSDDAVQRSHGDEPGSVDLTTTMAEDDWMQSALMDFGQVTDFPGAHHWGAMLDFDLDNMGMDMNVDLGMEMMDQLDNGHLPIDMMHLPSADPHVVPQAPIEAEGGLGDGGLANRDTDAIADAGNDAAKVTQSTAATASDSHMPSAQTKSDIEMQARTPSDETRPSPRSTAATGWPDSSKHTTTTAEDGPQSGHFAGNPLLSIITRALSQMNCYEDAGPDMNNNTSWPMGSQGMIGMPPAMPAC
ncbi:hypothetical protein HZS61_011193 [Fusarium oxysporum f. sp. conglutinans]|uniref:Uncharacterized protein n=2 Tax=Fusarium oxysporum f. sp. conglutinans TaxID=100902 RepID=A0A8H6GW10_FUSOX|nr:hypothetical protein HZS61_011193 [Fusarium oxysporum f. sp. conglutinans]KAG6997205.1 hypothetical protein FocnCong_v015473 [Fusarium oxysporum f. sp. conglutinans]